MNRRSEWCCGETVPKLARLVLAGFAAWAWMGAVSAADTNHGRELYTMHCVACHGASGVPVAGGTPDFTRLEGLMQPDPVLVSSIKAGRNAMPGFAGLLREREILDLIAYIRTLR